MTTELCWNNFVDIPRGELSQRIRFSTGHSADMIQPFRIWIPDRSAEPPAFRGSPANQTSLCAQSRQL